MFVNGTVSTTIDITILDDDLAEGVETFMGELVVSGPVNLITTIIVEILDNEGKNVIIVCACYVTVHDLILKVIIIIKTQSACEIINFTCRQ